MNVYHGSYTHIETIDLSQSEENKDFGKGFYITHIRKHAERWAERIAREHQATPVVTNLFYKSEIFAHLTDPKTNLYLRPWQEIYQMLQKELIPKFND